MLSYFRFPGITKAEEMLNEIYQNQNRNRTRPCVQSRSDMFRVFKYDINTAAEMSDHTQPLLLTRHNVVPGMFLVRQYMSRVMRKPVFSICENKDADQLRGNREADQRLCFLYTDSTIPLLPKYEISSL